MNKTTIITAVVTLAIGFFAGHYFLQGESFSGAAIDCSSTTCFTSLGVTGDLQVDGGTLNITTANTATSTVIVGCIQSYATSTATALKLQFTASTTAPTNGSGVIPVISYGTCPNL